MFLKKLSDNEFYSSLEASIEKTASFEEELIENKLKKVQVSLHNAAEKLQELGFEKEAQMVLMLEEVSDPATEDLDSESMLKNLEEKGWVFNSDDEVEEECSDCEDGEEPQLSQDELKKLRDLLK